MRSTYRILSVVFHTSCSELVYILVTLLTTTYWHNLCHVSIARRTAGNQLVSSHFCWNLLSHGRAHPALYDWLRECIIDRSHNIDISLSPPFPLNPCNKGTQCSYTIFFSNYQQITGIIAVPHLPHVVTPRRIDLPPLPSYPIAGFIHGTAQESILFLFVLLAFFHGEDRR